jgi:hypothetical protein
MAYDRKRDRVVLFGGMYANPLADTWEHDGTSWSMRSVANGPTPRTGHAMVYDSQRERIVLFGGWDGTAQLADTWEYDGTSWVQATVNGPPPRAYHSMAYDSARGRSVLFGGWIGGAQWSLDDTWEFDGTSWQQRATKSTPRARSNHAIAYDRWRNRVVLFGGYGGSPHLDDTWWYCPQVVAEFLPFGSGCAGAGGVPELVAAPGSLPWLGSPFTAQLRKLQPAIGVAFVLAGISNTQFGAIALPLELTQLHMPGCSLRVSVEFVYPLFNSVGIATWTVALPNDLSLAGSSLFVQGTSVDATANTFGMAWSNGAEIRFGAH